MGTEEVSAPKEAALTPKETDAISDLESKIIRQVEYYFGDHNLRRDKFLRYQTKLNDGWVTLETMVKFNRLKMLSEDFNVIAAALRKSPNNLLEVHEDGSQIRRNPEKPLPENSEENRAEVEGRSVYAKGFETNVTLDELIEYFKQFGNAINIQMRRMKNPSKKFKGSVFVTFDTKEEAEKFLELKEVKYKNTVLLREWKADYLVRKNNEFEERLKEKEKKKLEREKKAQNEEKMDEEKSEVKDTDASSNPEKVTDFSRGCLMKLSGFAEETKWEDIKAVLEPHGTVSFVDFKQGDPQAVVRFESPVAAEALEKTSKEEDGVKKIEICGVKVVAFVIEGDDEAEYWKKLKNRSHRPRQNKRGGRGWHNRGGGRHSKGRRNKRKFGEDSASENESTEATAEPSKKVAKVDAGDD